MSRRIDEKRVHEFIELMEKLPDILSSYEINKSSLASHVGMSRPTLNSKIKNKSFTAEELLRVVKYVNR